ncbi:Abi family protein [Sedimentibacter hydroxybenzoicus DSM 7310]|uniref:Abi family protein n=1 Tax=Sedimentibacter hydroxybenzoicus DSM 7310 TaxID=1123245 RepID=A0A974GVT9_SEDHY|nr:Abi family protein [Sedimentibacter hydroxybenzoicus]NYB73390.1 Abi family protein [Sedimentibacter hydroxybenzoicus DSM 7310]
MKELKTPDELITIMKKNGIKFNIVDEENAKHFLAEHNYYFKLSAYRKNYEKRIYPDGNNKYISLEFAYLQELSTIDMYLRYLVIKMCLDIEHSLKVNLVRNIEDNPDEDGYNITKIFLDKYDNILPDIIKHKSNSYCGDLIDAYSKKDIPIWVLIELISFGNLVFLYKLYDDTYGSFRICPLLFRVKNLRNAAAHSNCLINQLYKDKSGIKPYEKIRKFAKNNTKFGNTMIDSKLSNRIINDFITTLYVFDNVVNSEKIKLARYTELRELFNVRMMRNSEYFKDNEAIKTAYNFCKEVIDNLYSIAYNDNIN